MKEMKLLRRTTGLILALVMLFSFPVGAYSEGARINPEDAPEIPEGYVWRALSVELAPFEEDCLEKEEAEAARLAEKAEEAARLMELMLSRDAAVAEKEAEDDSEPVITVHGWMPEDVTARAELIPYSEKDLYAELALMQVELRFYDAAGQLWTPAVPVTVCVDGAAVREARDSRMDPTVYVYEEDFEAEEELRRTKIGDEPERLFSVQAFSAARAEGQEKSYELEEKEARADVVERALTKDDEFPNAVCFETVSESLRFAVTARQQDRNYSASTEDGETEIVVVGALPCGLSAQVASVSVEADEIELPGEVIRSWDLSLTHPEEADYQIDGSVKVALRDAALADAQNENWELQLWQLRENDTPVRVKNAAFRGEDLRFSASELSAYVVVRVAVETCLTTSDGNTYSVRVSYDSNAGIPADAMLEVRELLPEDAAYVEYLAKGAACAGQNESELDFARLFDISLRNPETGEEYQPDESVKVSIELLTEDVNENVEVNVVHFGQQTEVMGSVVSGDAIAFETKGFSVYVVMGVTLRKTITAADGNSYEISVTYNKDAGIPADAELKVRELSGEEYQQYLTKTAEYLSVAPEQLGYTRLFDITIEKDGVAYEPNKAVTVSVKLADRPETQGELCVVHFADAGTETLNNTLTEDGALQFETNSFSVYGITDKDGNVIDPLAYFEFYYSHGEKVGDDNNGTQIVRNNGRLNPVEEDENAGLYFLGWYVWYGDDNWGDAIDFSQPISVSVGAQGGITGNSVTVPRSEDPENPIVQWNVKVRARYTDNFVWLQLMKPSVPEQTDHVVMIPIPEGQDSMVFTIPDASNPEYTVASSNNEYTFYAWSRTAASSTARYYIANDPRTKVDSLTVRKGYTYKLYPMFKQGNWVFFNTSPVGAGATSIAPVFVTSGNRVAQPENPSWRGRMFLYWTTTPTFDKETGVVYQSKYPEQEDTYRDAPARFDFNQVISNVVPEGQKNLELYAHWEPGTSSYTVIVWKQSVQDDRNFSDSQKTYEFDSQYVIDWPTDKKVTLADASASLGINLTNLESDPATRANFAGFQHKVNQDPATGGYVDTVEATVLDNGSTVLNVYYDRKMVYFKFYNTNGSKPSFNHSYYITQPAATNRNAFWYYGLYGQDIGKYGYSWPKDRAWYFFHDDTSVSGNLMQEILPYFVLFDSVQDPNEPPVGDPAKDYYEETEIRLYSSSTANLVQFFYYIQQPDGTYLSNPNNTPYVGTVLLSGSASVKFDEIFEGYVCYGYQLIGTATGATGRTYSPTGWKTDFKNADGSYKRIPVYKGNVLHVAYERRKYTISYFDALDGKPLATPIQDGSGASVQVIDNVLFKEDIAKYYPDSSFTPESQVNGWRFNGRWYSDKECRVQIFFGETDEAKLWYYRDESGEKIYTDHVVTQAEMDANPERTYGKEESECFREMPNRNLALYAGFTKIWYWVKIDPNGGAFNNNDPSNINAKTYDKVEFDSVINEEWYNTISRNFVQDRAGTWYYHYDEFNMDDPIGSQPATRKAYYAEDPSVSTDGGKKYRPVANEEEGYEFAGWYKVENSNGIAGQKLTQYNFGDKITENTTLRAMWKSKGTFYVYYSLEYAVNDYGEPIDLIISASSTAPVDAFRYGADSTIPVLPSIMKATDSEGNVYELEGWYFNDEVVAPGGVHQAYRYAADQHPEIDKDNPRRPYNTFIFRPVFKAAADHDNNSAYTSLILDANGGRRNDAYTIPLDEGASFVEDGDVVELRYSTKLLLNMALKLPVQLPASDGGTNIFVKDNAEFLGWAFNKNATEPALYPKQIIGVDNNSGGGYNNENGNRLYAVWRMSEIPFKFRLREADSLQPIPNAKFELTGIDGYLISRQSGNGGDDLGGYLAQGDTITFDLKTPEERSDEYGNIVYTTYTLTEVETAAGYIPLPAPITITIDYFGNVDVEYDADNLTERDKESLRVEKKSGEYEITMYERPAICKVANGSGEKLFGTLNEAVDYIVDEMPDQTGTIQMIRHYVIPDDDLVTLDEDVEVTLTTAAKGVTFPFIEEDADVAVITRSESGNSLFTVNGGSLALNKIVLDGAGATCTGMTNGGLVCVNDDGELTVGEGATLRNSTVNKDGGAIYLGSDAEATVTNGSTITGNKAVNGAGIYVSADAELMISGNINFGGSGIEGESLSTTSGNFSTTPISGTNPTNATMSYAYGRQDIYLAETEEDDPKMLFVTGELTGGDGTIWLWAESENHYGKNRDFAEVTSPDLLTETTMHAFRNAREDSVTACGTKYLTGQVGTKKNWIAWTGGINVNFRKVDGFGKELAGAKFQLFTNLDCTESVMNKEGLPVTAISDDKGVVTFETVSSGIYYVQEVAVPKDENGNDLYVTNTNTYILLVGKEYVKVPEASDKITGAWANVLLGIKQEEINDQRNAYTEIFNDTAVYGEENPYKREVTDYAMFRLETKNNVTRYTTLPDIARIGIVNYSTTKRPVILSKINTVLMPLNGAEFKLLGIDGVEIEDENLKTSDASGVFFVGLLSVGTYMLEETEAPETYSKPTHYFVFQVTEHGVMALKRGESSDEESFGLTNTVTEASSDKYKITGN